MSFGKRKLLAVFLERDNLKLLAFEVSGAGVQRLFGGQITFSNDVLRDAFIADSVKFAAQVKVALSQKPQLSEASEVVLFIHPDKTFVKAQSASDSLDTFIRSLPYFKEELLIFSQEAKSGSAASDKVNHWAFEKKLVEDLERPFLDSGKKVTAVVSSVNVLSKNYVQVGRYLLLYPLEKEVTVLAVEGGVVLDVATFGKDVWVGRVNEFRLGKNFSDVTVVYTLGIFDKAELDKLRTQQNLTVTELATADIYDLMVESFVKGSGGVGLTFPGLPKVSFGEAGGKFPGQKYLFLVGAAVVGFVLVILLSRGLGKFKLGLPSFGGKPTIKAPVGKKSTASATPTAAPTPEASPSAFKVRVLNGTAVTGEAGRLADKLKGMGFVVTDTGNATSSGFAATRLRVASDVPEKIIGMLKSALTDTYDSVVQEVLPKDTVKVEVIIGRKKS